MQRALLASAATISIGAASRWPLNVPEVGSLEDVPSDFDCEMRRAAYSFGQELLPRMGKFESLYYALNLNDPACPPTEMVDVQAPKPALAEVPAGSVFVAPSGGQSLFCVCRCVLLSRFVVGE